MSVSSSSSAGSDGTLKRSMENLDDDSQRISEIAPKRISIYAPYFRYGPNRWKTNDSQSDEDDKSTDNSDKEESTSEDATNSSDENSTEIGQTDSQHDNTVENNAQAQKDEDPE